MRQLLLTITRFLAAKFVDQNSRFYYVTSYIKQKPLVFRIALKLFAYVNRGKRVSIVEAKSRPVRLLNARGLEIFNYLRADSNSDRNRDATY